MSALLLLSIELPGQYRSLLEWKEDLVAKARYVPNLDTLFIPFRSELIRFVSALLVSPTRNGTLLLERLEIAKLDAKPLAKFVGKDRTIEQATRSEKHHASLGLHSFRHRNATAMDSLGVPQQIRKLRIGHSAGNVTENYAHTFTPDERARLKNWASYSAQTGRETDRGN